MMKVVFMNTWYLLLTIILLIIIWRIIKLVLKDKNDSDDIKVRVKHVFDLKNEPRR
ncbi:hypothetical protein RGC47_06305 [Helicobacter pylori]|uniref:hypothetical protein n=1 Tax=Helicobacter pylori TaxID=210 RepID=UPI0029285E17|nr:hypothetical protein [Helicobacter pylori]MDU9770029.1 hypothetical protein [Helicobacter pylori]WRC89326.1 hypothetical protein E5K79_04250 [Helicobacter pylori]